MPYSFTQIEEDKSKVIGFVFAFLIGFYFTSALFVYLAAKFSWVLENSEYGSAQAFSLLTLPEAVVILVVAFMAGVIHWLVSTHNLIPKLLSAVGAESLNPKDTYHQMLQNIIDEVSIATGGRKMEGVVIPTMAMNAFAICDFQNRSVIGVTEGLLARLTRPQIEAVIGHEAAHIVTGDCLTTTVTSSLFKLYGSVLSGMNRMVGEGRALRVRSRGSGSFILVYAILWLINFFGTLVNMFISRQREFRADAIAVRLTRDPLSLAEALHTISRRWRGASLSGEELEAIFIVNPRFYAIDEQESLFSDLFSTHPPVQKRIQILLDMAHSNLEILEKEVEEKTRRPKQMAPGTQNLPSPSQSEWLIHKDGQWFGPFHLAQMMTLGWISPDTWIKKIEAEHMTHAFEDPEINQFFNKGQLTAQNLLCPRCRVALTDMTYEGASILRCPPCQGILTTPNDMTRILIRRDFEFSDRIKRMAEVIKKERFKPILRKIDVKTNDFLTCPRCQERGVKMLRTFYSMAYYVEVDRCVFCDSVWFDKDEMEVLQYLIEEAAKSETLDV